MRKGINHFLKELGILLFFAFPWFYVNILDYSSAIPHESCQLVVLDKQLRRVT